MRAPWRSFTDRADRDVWPTARLLSPATRSPTASAGASIGTGPRRGCRRARRLETFDFTLVPAVSKARVRVLASGDVWVGEWANVLLFGPPGKG